MEPIFIIGTERSGTNLLRLILNSHPSIAIPHPPHILKNFSRLEPLYGDLSRDIYFKRLIRDVVISVELHPYPWKITIDQDRIFQQAKARNLICIFFCIYDQYLKSAHKNRWGCKSTFMIYHVDLIRKYYCHAKFLYMVRDGRDVAASAKKTIFNHYSAYYTARLWKKEQQIGIAWMNKLSKEDILPVKYEDLLGNPQAMVKSVCSFLHEPYQESMLEYFNTAEARTSGNLSAAWKNTAQPIIRDNFQKYKVELRKKEIDLFEAIAGEELAHFAYPLSRPIEMLKNLRLSGGTNFRVFYFLEEVLLTVKVQLKHLFTDRNKFLRFKKFWFLQFIKIWRAWQ